VKTATLTATKNTSGLLIICTSVILAIASPAGFAQSCDNWVAKAVSVQGLVEKNDGSQEWIPLHLDETVCPGEKVRVGENSRAALHLSNNTYLRLAEKSLMSFPREQRNDGFWVELSEGVGHFISRIVNRFEVNTPYVNAAVEGTEFIVRARAPQGGVTVIEGKVLASNQAAREQLTAGQQANASNAQSPLTRLTVNSQTSVEWAIHYPPVLTLDSLHPSNAEDARRLNEIVLLNNAGRPDLALQQFPQNQVLSAELSIARAAILLGVGRVTDAEAELTANMNAQKAPAANAMLAVSHASRNDGENALKYATKATEAGPTLALTYIARSYAEQANLQLNAARASAVRATEVESDNLVAWQRLSELELVTGHVSAAAAASERARKLAPENPDVLTGAGFVALFELKLKNAESLFRQALKQGSNNPQTRLGLGLTLLRSGDLQAGREQLEYAASLDPSRSVIRSYLGRAYFEEKRDDQASTQWELAKQFDPNDPTPYFYQGVEKLFANDPSGAIREIEMSQELNDKRGVYRSDTLLQSDSATKSAALARAYGETGNDQAVLIKGTDALSQDPTNAEGHRLLADRYAALPRHDAARVSELLQAQLWGPLSAYPIQPQLSETSLAIIEGLGPARQGLNEYHSLFTQNGGYALLNGFVGSDDTWGNDAVASFLQGPIALSLGQYRYETDGFRKNADQSQEIYNVLAQWQATSDTSLQLEARHFDWEYGDLSYSIFDTPSERARNSKDVDTYRFGLKHQFDTNHAVLFSAMSQQADAKNSTPLSSAFPATVQNEANADLYEIQDVLQFPNLKLISGAGHAKSPDESSIETSIFIPELGMIVPVSESSRSSHEHNNAYVYAILQLDGWVLEPAISYDELETDDIQDKEWSPKLGATFHLTENIEAHAAIYKNFKRYLATKQTIEPTNILGSNQFYEDLSGTISKNKSAYINFTPNDIFSFGVSGLIRDAESPVYEDLTGDVSRYDIRQTFGSVYGAYMPTPQMALTIKYLYEDYDFSDLPSIDLNTLASSITRSVPVAISYFLNKNWSLNLEERYINQINNLNLSVITEDDLILNEKISRKESGAITTFSIKRKLPNRLGELQIGAQNLFDSKKQYVGSNLDFLRTYPERFIFARVQLSL